VVDNEGVGGEALLALPSPAVVGWWWWLSAGDAAYGAAGLVDGWSAVAAAQLVIDSWLAALLMLPP
jgi:hypothetical protein